MCELQLQKLVKCCCYFVTDAPCPSSSTSWSINLGESRGSGIISSTYPKIVEVDPSPQHCTMVILDVPSRATLGVYTLHNTVAKDTADSDNDLLYISEGDSNVLNLYGRSAPTLYRTTGSGTLNFKYKPEVGDLISRVRFIFQLSGKTYILPLLHTAALYDTVGATRLSTYLL